MSHHIPLWIWNLYVYLSIDSLMVVRVGWKKCWRHWRQMTILNTFVALGHYNECMHLHIDRLTTNISIISIMHMLEGIAHIMLCACTRKHFRRIYFRHTFLNLYLTWEKRVRMFLFQWGCCPINISNLHANDVRMSLPKYLIHIPSCEISSWLLPMLHTIQSETSKQNHRNFTALKPPTNQDEQHGITQNARNSSVSAS